MDFTQMLTAAEADAPIVIDGGLGTALEERGVDLDHALWSADLLRRRPEAIAEVHAAFAAAGARILTTASYQATPVGFARAAVPVAEGRDLIAAGVEVARTAAEAVAGSTGAARALVAGSVGPFGAALGGGEEYTGDYRLTAAEYADFHHGRIAALAAAGVDLLAIETQPRLDEIRILVQLAEEVGLPAWLSVTLGDAGGLPDGSGLADLAEEASASAAVAAVGVNCVPPSAVAPALRTLSAHTDLPLIAYPNSGERYAAESMQWLPKTAESGSDSWPVDEWTRLGARLIGGCCRTTPADISVLSRASSPG
ncbi:homocysteine S-methyltransferase [Brevibacterium renqingii]|uniref:homocysteine S-methyltransferase n=1 Tax=Brevibacterium renqingii TaxID=2776916 RepID=UPI001ADFC20B|nr:homocysteine S-methyltransferase [Brevibacterium renqingii]